MKAFDEEMAELSRQQTDAGAAVRKHPAARDILQVYVPGTPAGWTEVGSGHSKISGAEGETWKGGSPARYLPADDYGRSVVSLGTFPQKQQEMMDLVAATLAYNDVSPAEVFAAAPHLFLPRGVR